MAEKQAKRFVAPEVVKANARRAIDAIGRRSPNRKGLTDFQISRAMDLTSDLGVTLDTVKGIYSFLSPIMSTFDVKDRTDKRWLGVIAAGGPSALAWAQDVIERELESDFL